MVDLSKHRLSSNPFAPPDWRYRLARACLHSGKHPSFRDDEATWDLFRFMRKREAADQPSQRAELRRVFEGFSIAFDLHHGKGRTLRPNLEAYLLAGAADEAIATRLALPEAAISRFRSAFCDVVHLLSAPLRVYQWIGITDEDGDSVLDNHRMAKFVGYRLGTEGLDQLLGIDGTSNVRHEKDVAAWALRQMKTVLAVKQMIAAQGLNVQDPKQAAMLLKLALQGQQDKDRSNGVPLNQVEQHIKALWQEILFVSGEEGEEHFAGTKIGELDEGASELRDHELWRTAAGEEVPGLEEDMLTALPPPRKRKPLADSDDEGLLSRL